ncbi:MAG: translation initiation factor IF-2 associated domain-containing protein, partial [Duodenibacillus sp.]|nr:translation initiation factor IF-2 associated domain-containing protein [Duodenibacillus sp.]
MAQNTVIDIARELRISANEALTQLKALGIVKSGAYSLVTDEEKARLIEAPRPARPAPAPQPQRPGRVSVTRREQSTIRGNDGHSIAVEVRRKRTFVKNPRTAGDDRAAAIEAERQKL